MAQAFDISLDSLRGHSVAKPERSAGSAPTGFETHYEASRNPTFYLETFGCQMNEHDSEKVAGVLLSRGYRQVESADTASLILYNTCSIREKAAQKVFSRLGEFRDRPSEGRTIGVLGCV